MAENVSIQQVIEAAHSLEATVAEKHQEEMRLLIKDLEEAKTTLFVRTAEAKPMIERCWNALEALKAAGSAGGADADDAFDEFDTSVSKLRNTILVRTQRAT